MPIIDFPYYLDSIGMRAAIYGRGTILGDETVDGFGSGDLGATINGASNLYPNISIDGEAFVGAIVSGTGTISGTAAVSVALGGATISSLIYLFGDLQNYGGRGFIGPLVSLGSDRELAQGIAYLPALYSAADGDFYIPPLGSRHYAVLTGLTSVGILKNPDLGVGILPALVSQGWDNSFDDSDGGGLSYFGPLIGSGAEGLRLEALMPSYVFALNAIYTEMDIVVVFSSNMTVADVYTATRILVQEYLESATTDDTFSFLGSYLIDLSELLGATSSFLSNIGVQPGTITENTTTWVFNVDNGGTTQYDNYGFNSFAKRGTEYLAAAPDGIYTLSGDDDEGTDISAEISLALSRYATPQAKYFPTIYLGVTSTGKMILKANVDGTDWLFEANNTTATMANQRVDLGKGLRGSHWHFTILNQNGVDFDLESVEFLPLVSSRRVY